MKFPAEKNATFTQFHGAKQTGPANPPSYWHHILSTTNIHTQNEIQVDKEKYNQQYLKDFFKVVSVFLPSFYFHKSLQKLCLLRREMR